MVEESGCCVCEIIQKTKTKTDCICTMVEENRSCVCEMICQCLSKTFLLNLNISKGEENDEKEEIGGQKESRTNVVQQDATNTNTNTNTKVITNTNTNSVNAAEHCDILLHAEFSQSPTNKRKTEEEEEEEEVAGTKKAKKQSENPKRCQNSEPSLESNPHKTSAKPISSLSLFCIRCGFKFNQLAKLMLHRKSHPTMKALKGLIVSITSMKKFSNKKAFIVC